MSEMDGVNLQQAKRAREEGTSQDPSFVSRCGKDAAKLLSDFAAKLLGAIKSQLMQRAIAARKKLAATSAAVANLQLAADKNEAVCSLRLRRSPAMTAILEATPELAAKAAALEIEALKVALHQRQQERAHLEQELTAICDGSTFLTAAKESLRLERFTFAEAAVLQDEMVAAEAVFKLAVKLKFLEFDDTEAKAAAAKKKRMEDKEVRRMEFEQQPTHVALQHLVDKAVAKRLGVSKQPARRSSPSPRRVTFADDKPQQGRRTSRSQSRGRSSSRGTSRGTSRSASRSASRSTSRGRSQERPQTPFPGRGKGQQRRRPPRTGGGASSRPHSRSASPSPRASREPRHYQRRDISQGNGRGGRGARPHRPPSGMHGGSARVGGGGGFRTGPRR
ncbi:g10030 [Coccomyxa elongata]